mmetsp:Transcript_89000/g.237365  ORF Transcript_89000/g.237365 Transcript_89000/m.237365 type:complete len:213 (-) Transcript_89000:12-650(-)
MEHLFRYLHPDKLPKLKRVIVVDNEVLRAKFEQGLAELDSQGARLNDWPEDPLLETLRIAIPESPYKYAKPALLWHCTSDGSEAAICSGGYSLEKLGGATKNKGWYGAGLYFTTIPSYATWYAHSRTAAYKAGDICITLNWVLTGRPTVIPSVQEGRPLERGFTTHYAVTSRTRPIQESILRGQYTKPMDGDELVVFDESHTLPQFVVELDV